MELKIELDFELDLKLVFELKIELDFELDFELNIEFDLEINKWTIPGYIVSLHASFSGDELISMIVSVVSSLKTDMLQR